MRRPEPYMGEDATMTLDRLLPCERATIEGLSGSQAVQTRLRDLGFREGNCVVMVKQAPLADPIEFRVLGAHVSLRHSEARLVEVSGVQPIAPAACHGRGPGHLRGAGWLGRLRRWRMGGGGRGGGHGHRGRGAGRGGCGRRGGPRRGGPEACRGPDPA